MSKPKHYAVQSFQSSPRPFIALTSVDSNLIAAVGYDKGTATLAVTFKRKDGPPTAVYHYPDVSPVLHAEFIGAESLGKFHGEHIKPLPFKKYHPDPVAEDGSTETATEDALDHI